MQMKTLIVIGWALIFVLSKEGGDCDEKAILDRNKLIYTSYGDTKIAYNHACCYLKVKFKNSISDKKYTHRGCIQVSLSEWQNIDDLIDRLENNITSPDRNVTLEKKDVHIDCNSNYIKLAGLLIFALLL